MIKLILSVLMLFVLSFCAMAQEVKIGAGVGLKDVLNDLSVAFVEKYPSVKATKNLAPAGVLAKQMDSGAILDLVIFPDVKWMDYLKEKKHVDAGSIAPVAYNTLVFIGPSTTKAANLNDLVRLDRIAIGSPKSVPAGEYAMEALKKAGIDKKLEKKLVMARDVRQCLTYAERGEIDGAFVYRTDALLAKHAVILFSVPRKFYSPIVCMMALTVSGVANPAAARFFSFLQSEEGKEIIARHGFEIR
jgi:molybdate transport system substrate-binding protein